LKISEPDDSKSQWISRLLGADIEYKRLYKCIDFIFDVFMHLFVMLSTHVKEEINNIENSK
jgi:hypothetical protein